MFLLDDAWDLGCKVQRQRGSAAVDWNHLGASSAICRPVASVYLCGWERLYLWPGAPHDGLRCLNFLYGGSVLQKQLFQENTGRSWVTFCHLALKSHCSFLFVCLFASLYLLSKSLAHPHSRKGTKIHFFQGRQLRWEMVL